MKERGTFNTIGDGLPIVSVTEWRGLLIITTERHVYKCFQSGNETLIQRMLFTKGPDE